MIFEDQDDQRQSPVLGSVGMRRNRANLQKEINNRLDVEAAKIAHNRLPGIKRL